MLRRGEAHPFELFDLRADPTEAKDRLQETALRALVQELSREALRHRNAGGHRFVPLVSDERITFDWVADETQFNERRCVVAVARSFDAADAAGVTVTCQAHPSKTEMTVSAVRGDKALQAAKFNLNRRGLGVDSGRFGQVDDGEAILVRFDRDVLVESASIVAGNGQCGGFYRVGDHAPLAIYCVDADIDAQDQSGILSDIGILKQGQTLRLDSSPHYGVESPGQWRLSAITIRLID